MKKEISVIIVTYNSEKLIFDCIDSLYKYNDIGNMLEIIVVDNNSDNVNKMFSDIKERYGNDIILIKNNKNKGYGQGNNVGIRNATGSIIMIMNPDVRLLLPVFSKALSHFFNSKTIILGMKQMVTETKRGLSFMVKLDSSPILSILETILFNKLELYNYKRMYFSGACFFIQKNEFIKIGLFDESVFMYGEENDIHYRLLKSKVTGSMIYDKNLKYLHLVDNRPPTMKAALETLNASIHFCKINNIDVNKIINREISKAVFFKNIEKLKGNKSRVKFYTELLVELNSYILK